METAVDMFFIVWWACPRKPYPYLAECRSVLTWQKKRRDWLWKAPGRTAEPGESELDTNSTLKS